MAFEEEIFECSNGDHQIFSVALVAIILIVVATNSAAGHITYSSIRCNTQKMASGDPFVGTVTKLLSLLVETKGQMKVVLLQDFRLPLCTQ